MVLLHPGYISNSAHFAVIAQRDVVWDLSGHYQKQTFRNRSYIATDRGKLLLSIPIVHNTGKGKQAYKEVKLDDSEPWKRTHWRSIETAYRTSPFFEYYEEQLMEIYFTKDTYLLDFNLRSTELLLDCLGLAKPKNKIETYEVHPKDGIDARFLIDAKNSLNFKPTTYHQVFGDRHDFLPNMSTIDLICNEGPNASSYLRSLELAFLNP